MTGFKPGDRVHVEFDGTIDETAVALPPDCYVSLVAGDGRAFDVDVPVQFCTVVRAPLQVGDVLTADDPEPPEDTVVMFAASGVVWRNNGVNLQWQRIGDEGGYDWSWLVKGAEYNTLTVAYVPEDAS